MDDTSPNGIEFKIIYAIETAAKFLLRTLDGNILEKRREGINSFNFPYRDLFAAYEMARVNPKKAAEYVSSLERQYPELFRKEQ